MPSSIESFVGNARIFCELVQAESHDVKELRRALLALMQGVLHLDRSLNDDSAGAELPRRGHDGWIEDVSRLADLPLQYYGMDFNPLALDRDSWMVGDLCDDFADIYAELWHGLQVHDAGATIYAENHWVRTYHQHWGRHAIGAVSAIDAHIRQDEG